MEPQPEPQRPRQTRGPHNLRLTPAQRDELLIAMAQFFNIQMAAESMLDAIGFPRERRPPWTGDPESVWRLIFAELDAGIIDRPWYQLLRAALRRYPYNTTFLDLDEASGRVEAQTGGNPVNPGAAEAASRPTPTVAPTLPPEPEPATASDDSDTDRDVDRVCHVIVRASSEDERERASALLSAAGLDPADLWSTAHATSYRVATADVRQVRQALDDADIGWIVVPPGSRDYLIRELYVQGPDGRRFRLLDAPAQQTVADVAASVVGQYGKAVADTSRPTIMDLLLPGGATRRLPPEVTLEEAGVRDGNLMRLGFEATAGAINPLDHQDALHRMRNQILRYARLHPSTTVSGAPPTLPTQYEISFQQNGFGPPETADGPPVRIHEHTVLVQLGPEFPETAPAVFWLTPIFHPNVYPNYDSEQARRQPDWQGLVCLGELAESYTPSLDFADLCQTLVDVAGYRNYSIFAPTGEVAAGGVEGQRVNYYDGTAAAWAQQHQDEIRAIGGYPTTRHAGALTRYRNVVEAADT
jgi:hypothetical protein